MLRRPKPLPEVMAEHRHSAAAEATMRNMEELLQLWDGHPPTAEVAWSSWASVVERWIYQAGTGETKVPEDFLGRGLEPRFVTGSPIAPE
eukprot:753296-Alexandrium_andersonii.AAC.1